MKKQMKQVVEAKKKLILWKIALFVVPILIVLLPIVVLLLVGSSTFHQDNVNSGSCSKTGDIDQVMWNDSFAKANVLADKGSKMIMISRGQGIDPVLFAAIAFHETAWGTSKAVNEKNNPGGLMGSNGLMVFATLDEGLEAMGVTLHNRIIEDGYNTIEQLGDIYAPVGAANDPLGLNVNWIPTVNRIAQQLGGLTMNCDQYFGSNGQYILPIDNPIITSWFGMRWGKMHKGIDFGHPIGTPIKAIDSGVIELADLAMLGSLPGYGGYGSIVQIQHGNRWSLYAHMDKIQVRLGQKVNKGDVIGTVGNTGNSTGPHLHLEIRTKSNGGQIDPAPLLGLQPPK